MRLPGSPGALAVISRSAPDPGAPSTGHPAQSVAVAWLLKCGPDDRETRVNDTFGFIARSVNLFAREIRYARFGATYSRSCKRRSCRGRCQRLWSGHMWTAAGGHEPDVTIAGKSLVVKFPSILNGATWTRGWATLELAFAHYVPPADFGPLPDACIDGLRAYNPARGNDRRECLSAVAEDDLLSPPSACELRACRAGRELRDRFRQFQHYLDAVDTGTHA